MEHHPKPDLPAPVNSVGPVAWMRANLFSSLLNTILTLVCVLLLLWVLPGTLNWLLFQATWGYGDRSLCEANPDGACWAFVRVRYLQILFGLRYASEPDQLWRPLLFFALLIMHGVWILHPRFGAKVPGIVSLLLIMPPLSYGLLEGTWFGLLPIDSSSWGGLLLTVILASFGIVMALPLGILLALGRRSNMPVVRTICIGFIEFWRGTPLITVLFMASVMLPLFFPSEVDFNKVLRAMIGITLFQSAYTAEAIRAGLQAIPKGQMEASKSLGLSYWQAIGLIILPQALRISIPGIVNTFIELFKDTSLVVIIGLLDLLNMANVVARSQEWRGFEIEAYIFAGIIYWICCFAMSRYSQRLERKLDTTRQD